MNKKIKDRIDKIEEGIVPKGYKKTKLGIIPEDWEVKRFNEIIETLTDYVANGSFASLKENVNYVDKDKGYAMLLRLQDASSNYQEEFRYIDKDSYEFLNKSKTYPGDIIISNVGARCGLTFRAPNLDIRMSLGPNSILLRTREFNDYIYNIFKSEIWDKMLLKIISTSAQPKFNKTDFRTVEIPIPPMQEQEKIADILSTWDKSIETIEKLIKEKETQKKGLMQKLLTGETRLPGFNGEWKEVKLGELSKIVTGTTPLTKKIEYYGGDFPWVTPTDIGDDKYIRETERSLSGEGMKVGRYIPKNSLLITCIASIGKNTILEVDGSCNQQINAIYPSNIHSNEYLYYLLSYKKNYLLSYASKTATMLINKNTFENIKFILPPLSEQKAIANILSTSDKEIELLRELLEAKRREKGLMQLLLTGIVRV